MAEKHHSPEAGILAALAGAIDASPDLDRILQKISDAARELCESDGALVMLPEPDAKSAVSRYWTGARRHPVTFRAEPGKGLGGLVLTTGGPVRTANYGVDPRFSPDYLAEVTASGMVAVLAVPIRLGGGIGGLIYVGNREERPFTERDERLLELLADHAAIAIANARLLSSETQRREQLETVTEIAREFTAVLSREPLLALVVQRAGEFFRADGAIYLLDDGHLTLQASSRRTTHIDTVALGDGLVGACAVNRQGRIVNDYPSWPSALPRAITDGVTRIMGYPLSLGDKLLGVIGMLRTGAEAPPFGDDDLIALEQFAAQAALALHNAGLHEEAFRRRREVEVIETVTRTINATLDLDTVLQCVVEGARELCGCDMARIALRDPASGAMVFQYWENARYQGYGDVRVEPGQGVGGQVLLTGRPFRTDNWVNDTRLDKTTLPVILAEGVIAQMAVPIISENRVDGLLYVDHRSPRAFTEDDEAALTKLAVHAALAIHNARLFAELEATHTRLQAMSARLLDVQEAERRHIARELHDEIGQALTAVRINLQMLKLAPANATAGRVDDSLGILDRVLQSVRQLSLDLRPSLLDDLGLAAALHWYVETQAQRANLAGDVVIELDNVPVPPALGTVCFRVAQEAITNVIRHARASRVSVTLRGRDGGLELVVEDDGIGFDVAAARRHAGKGRSLGLLGLDERVTLAGGSARIDSAPGAGTRVTARLPLLDAGLEVDEPGAPS